jgi:hypothetical protein
MSLKKELTKITLGDGRVFSVTGEQMENYTDLDTCTAYRIALQAKIDVVKGRAVARERGEREEEEMVGVRARAYRIAMRAKIDEEKGHAEARERGEGEEEEGEEEEEEDRVKKRIKKERPGVTAVDCIEHFQGYGRLRTSKREDGETESQAREA